MKTHALFVIVLIIISKINYSLANQCYDIYQNLFEKRSEIGTLLHSSKYIELKKIPGILNIQLGRKDFSSCTSHVFGPGNYPQWLGNKYEWLSGYEEIHREDLQLNDIVFYFEKNGPTHVGFWKGNNTIESKWGIHPVFQHEVWTVPLIYGDSVRFFRKRTINDSLKNIVEEYSHIKNYFPPLDPLISQKELMLIEQQLKLFSQESNRQNRTRTLLGKENSYAQLFGRAFVDNIFSLTDNDLWLDAGSGSRQAMHDFTTLSRSKVKNPFLLSVDIEKIEGHSHELVKELVSPVEAISSAYDGTVSIITDSGPFSYSLDPSKIIRTYGRLLKPGGKAFIFFNPMQLRIYQIDGARIHPDSWLNSVTGFKLTKDQSSGAYIFTRTDEALSVPHLFLSEIYHNFPPERYYRILQ